MLRISGEKSVPEDKGRCSVAFFPGVWAGDMRYVMNRLTFAACDSRTLLERRSSCSISLQARERAVQSS